MCAATNTQSKEADQKSQIHIPIFGLTEVGKTTYLAATYLELKSSDGWDIWPHDARSFRFIEQQADLLQKGEFGAATPPGAPPSDPYVFKLKRHKVRWWRLGREKELQLAVWDAPGEMYKDPLASEDTYREFPRYRKFFDTIHAAKGIICLMDIDISHKDDACRNYQTFIRRTIFALQRSATGEVQPQIKRPVAWVLTKMDRTERWPYREDGWEYAAEILGEQFLASEIERVCRNHRWFAVSSVGVIEDPLGSGHIVPNYERDPGGDEYKSKIKRPQERQPFRITKPIEWLLEELT